MMRDGDAISTKANEIISYALVIYITDTSRTVSINNVKWIIDSGCTQHSCNDINAFTKMTNKRMRITIADGTVLESSGRGTVGNFNDVNYIPEFKHNLLSVHQLTLDGYNVIFTTEGTVIIQSSDGS